MSTEYLTELVTFVLMLVLIGWLGWPRIVKVAEKQQDRIAAQLAEAQRNRAEITESLEASRKQLDEAKQQAAAILEQAKKTAADDAEETRAKAKREADAFLTQATTQIAAERERAVMELRREMSELVVGAASSAVAKALTPDAHKRLVSESVGRLAPDPGAKN